MAFLQKVSPFLRSARLIPTVLLALAISCTTNHPGDEAPVPAPTATDLDRIAETIRTNGLTREGAFDFLEALYAVGPRLTGSDGAARGVDWAKKTFESLGFETWLEKILVPHWVRGEAAAEIILPGAAGRDPLAAAGLGGSIPTPPAGLTAKVIEVKSFDELEKAGSLVRGRIVFFNAPMDRALMDTFRAYGEAAQFRVRGASEAAKRGAVASIVRSPTGRLDDHPHTGIVTYEPGAPRVPAAAISTLGADLLSARLRERPDAEMMLRMTCETLPDAASANVVGQIRGTEKPEEIVLLGAHLDSWDLSAGANDDAAGCAQCLEALRLIRDSGLKPKRTIRAVLFMNEEFGGSGGRDYAAAAGRSRERHIAAMESDRGAGAPEGFLVGGGTATLEKLKAFEPLLRPSGILWIRPGGGGVDIGPLAAGGAVMMSFMPDVQRYFDYHHSALDTLDSVHPRELELGAIVMAVMAAALAEKGI
jgi:hypothetical protein